MPLAPAVAQDGAPTCAPGGDPVAFEGEEALEDAGSYRLLYFDVVPGSARVEGPADPAPS